jgi:hypothetical protein
MLRLRAWWWKRRHYTSEPARPVQFSYGNLMRLYGRWRASGGNPEALALHWRPPVKLRKSQVLAFAGVCINSDVRSFAEAFGRLPNPQASVFAYRLRLKPKMLLRILRVFAARRLLKCRERNARSVLNAFAQGGPA